ncbi:MAG TPA: hypothetical protein VF821_14250 [Lentzea sp.]
MKKTMGIVLALGALLVTGAGVAQADITTSVDAGSRVRAWAGFGDNVLATVHRQTGMTVECYQHGADYNDGHTHTDVWYYGDVWGPRGFVWGGNVNTQQDPPPGLREC